jgi:hypothetical protein
VSDDEVRHRDEADPRYAVMFAEQIALQVAEGLKGTWVALICMTTSGASAVEAATAIDESFVALAPSLPEGPMTAEHIVKVLRLAQNAAQAAANFRMWGSS